MLDFNSLPDCALLRQRQLLTVVPFSSATLWRRVQAGTFPQPVRLEGGRVTAWTWGSVRAWLVDQATEAVLASKE
jgi:prophage regulatory protein